MPFHVEISQGTRHARVFNLSPAELRDQILVPWLAGREVDFADRSWVPSGCELVVLEGPQLEGPDLAHGQGWNSAHRTAHVVTDGALEAVRASFVQTGVVVLASEPQDISYVGAALERLGYPVADWPAVRERLLAAEPGDDVIVLIAVGGDEPPGEWWFDAGVALAALRHRVVVVETADTRAPGALAALDPIRLDAGDDVLGERLRDAGAPRAG